MFTIPQRYANQSMEFASAFKLPLGMLPRKGNIDTGGSSILTCPEIAEYGTSRLGAVMDMTTRLWNCILNTDKKLGIFSSHDSGRGDQVGYRDTFTPDSANRAVTLFIYFNDTMCEADIQRFEESKPDYTPEWDNPVLTNMLKPGNNSVFKVYTAKDPNQIKMVVLTNIYNWDMQYKILGVMTKYIIDKTMHNTTNHPLSKTDLTEILTFFALLTKNDNKGLESYLNNFKNIAFIKNMAEEQFDNLFRSPVTKQLTTMQRQDRELERDIEVTASNLTTLMQQRRDLQDRIMGMLLLPDTDVKDKVKEYLRKSKYITHFYYDYNEPSRWLHLLIEAPIQYWDDHVAKRLLASSNRSPNSKTLIQALFTKQTHKIWCTSHIKLDINSGALTAERDAVTSLKAVPHPHLDAYRCYGGNRGLIEKSLATGDYILLFEQALAAHYNINLLDGAVFGTFLSNLTMEGGKYEDLPCIEVIATGELITPKQLFEGEQI